MKIERIIDDLIKHRISEYDAIQELKEIALSEKYIRANVESVAFTSENNHGILKLEIPYGYRKIEDVKKGDKIYLKII